MHDIRVLQSGDMCMTLSGHTSTLLRLVIWGDDFEGHSLECRFGPTSYNVILVGLLTEVMIILYHLPLSLVSTRTQVPVRVRSRLVPRSLFTTSTYTTSTRYYGRWGSGSPGFSHVKILTECNAMCILECASALAYYQGPSILGTSALSWAMAPGRGPQSLEAII